MPRVTSWKLPATLWLLGLSSKVLLSALVDESLGTWVGGALGVATTVTFLMYAWHRSQEAARGREPAAHRGADDPS